MGCNLIGFPPRSPSLPHCGPLQTAMLFREIGRATRAAEEGRDIISQARGEIFLLLLHDVFEEFLSDFHCDYLLGIERVQSSAKNFY